MLLSLSVFCVCVCVSVLVSVLVYCVPVCIYFMHMRARVCGGASIYIYEVLVCALCNS